MPSALLCVPTGIFKVGFALFGPPDPNFFIFRGLQPHLDTRQDIWGGVNFVGKSCKIYYIKLLKICLLGTRTEEKYIYFWERIFFTETTAPEDPPTFLGPPVALNLRGLNFLATPWVILHSDKAPGTWLREIFFVDLFKSLVIFLKFTDHILVLLLYSEIDYCWLSSRFKYGIVDVAWLGAAVVTFLLLAVQLTLLQGDF